MGFLRRDDDDTQAAPQAQSQAVAPADAPHAATSEAGSLAGIPESGRERIERMKQEVARVVHRLGQHPELLALVPHGLLEADVVDRAAQHQPEGLETGLLDK